MAVELSKKNLQKLAGLLKEQFEEGGSVTENPMAKIVNLPILDKLPSEWEKDLMNTNTIVTFKLLNYDIDYLKNVIIKLENLQYKYQNKSNKLETQSDPRGRYDPNS